MLEYQRPSTISTLALGGKAENFTLRPPPAIHFQANRRCGVLFRFLQEILEKLHIAAPICKLLDERLGEKRKNVSGAGEGHIFLSIRSLKR
jgi:hypothetical protein